MGKTSLLYAFLDKKLRKVETTLGIDFFTKTICMDQQDVHLSMWDTAGAERYRSLMHSYIRDAECIVLVYDTSVRQNNIVQWMRVVEQHNPKVIGVLGNKTDLTTAFDADIDEILFPWRRQDINLVVDTCTSREPDQIKNFMKRCLKILLTQKKESRVCVEIPTQAETPKSNSCCT